jgi:excisionase family DNA binding protein
MAQDAAQPTTLTVVEVAKRLKIGRNQAYQAVHKGQIPSVRIGHRLLVPTVAFERWLEDAAAALRGKQLEPVE